MSPHPVIVWFRQDLRLDDNPALSAAVSSGAQVIPLYIWSPEDEGRWRPGAASRWWLHHSLTALEVSLSERGSYLVIRAGEAADTVVSLAQECGVPDIFWSRRYEPALRQQERQCAAQLHSIGVRVHTFPGALLHDPEEIRTVQGGPFQVFTPFWRRCLSMELPASPVGPPARIASPGSKPQSLSLKELHLEPEVDWAQGLRTAWEPGEKGALRKLDTFLAETIGAYPVNRDRPDIAGTSRLSPHIHFGEISPHRILKALDERVACLPPRDARNFSASADVWKRQIVWREFACHLLYNFPHTTDEPLRDKFAAFPWRDDVNALRCWQRGRTGYPIVDAGMRELWTTGWMHNRVRMIVASFLTKDLLIPWQQGARWFWDTLVDADLPNNTLGWQWTAGCGADAAPYFRIFSPVGQAEKFDPEGRYVRRWVPELGALPAKWIHKPWEAPESELRAVGIGLGETYPKPIVDHAVARHRALESFARIGESRNS